MSELKPISRSFIMANIFDMISTVLAIMNGGVELNPIVVKYGWGPGIASKLMGIIMIVCIAELFETRWFFWIIPIIVWVAVFWNTLVFISLVI